MRIILLCATLSFLGCGDDATPVMDLSVAPDLQSVPDLSVRDLSPGPLTCGGFVTCIMSCTSQTCATDCLTRLTPSGTTKLNTLINCGDVACSADVDGGSGDCSGAGDMSQTCLTCALGIIQSGGCPTELSACTSDTL